MNLYKLALGGLGASQVGLATTGHNINNATTEGYNRQRVLLSTAGAQATGAGFVGRGVQIDTVTRSYDSFLYRQLVSAKGTGSQLETQLSQMSQVNNLFADTTVGISPALTSFFTSINAVASSPADTAARQDMIGKANSLVTQINSAYQELQDQRTGLNTQIATTVEQVNSYLNRINDLNNQIVIAQNQGSGDTPNDLLDQRDQAVMELNQLVGVTSYEQGGRVSLTLSGGQALLSGDTVYPLQAVSSASDVSRTAVAYTVPAGAGGKTVTVELPDSTVTGGTLGGLVQFRSTSLDMIQNQLGQMAVGLAMAFNEAHNQGVDLTGVAGTDFFGLTQPEAIANTANKSTAQISGTYTSASNLTASDYSISFDGTNYMVTRLPENTLVFNGPATGTPGTIDLDGAAGISLSISSPPAAGDKWIIQPTRNAARDISLEVTDPSKIAAADSEGGSANGANALELAKLQTSKVLGNGTTSVTEMFSKMVNTVGVQTQQVSSASTAQQNLITQKTTAQQSVSGVNLNEEYVNLTLYQEQYQASARLIDVASTIFDTLLGLRG